MSESKAKSQVKTFSLKKDTVSKIDEYSKRENRSISNFVETILQNYFNTIEQKSPSA